MLRRRGKEVDRKSETMADEKEEKNTEGGEEEKEFRDGGSGGYWRCPRGGEFR